MALSSVSALEVQGAKATVGVFRQTGVKSDGRGPNQRQRGAGNVEKRRVRKMLKTSGPLG